MKFALPAFISVLAMSTTFATEWEKLPPLPEPNGGFVCGAIGDTVVIAGGTNWRGDQKHWFDDVWVFDPGRKRWRTVGKLAAPLAYATQAEMREGLCFAGGSDGTKTHRTLVRIDRVFAATAVATIEPQLVYASGAIFDGKLFAIGGAPDQAKIEEATNACRTIDLTTGASARIADLPVSGFVVGAAAACGGRVYVFGGCEWDAAAGAVRNLATAFVYLPAEDRWQPLPPLPTATRGLNAIALDSQHIFLAGGFQGDAEGFTADAFIFHPATGEYRPAPPLPYAAMVGLAKCGGYLYCLGGEDKKAHRTDGCHRIPIAELLK